MTEERIETPVVSFSLADQLHGTCPVVLDAEPVGADEYAVSFCHENMRVDNLGPFGHPDPEQYDTGIPLNGNRPSIGRFSASELVDIVEGDRLLRVNGDLPDEVPIESVIHVSRPDWPYGNDAPEPEQRQSFQRR